MRREELLLFMSVVAVAGSETTTRLIGWAGKLLSEHPDQRRTLVAERDTATVSAYVQQYAPDLRTTAAARDPRIVRRVSWREASSRIPYPLAPYYLVQIGDTASSHPVRREMPVLDDGPHRSYAIQWFFFAAIALGGALAVVWRERRMP